MQDSKMEKEVRRIVRLLSNEDEEVKLVVRWMGNDVKWVNYDPDDPNEGSLLSAWKFEHQTKAIENNYYSF